MVERATATHNEVFWCSVWRAKQRSLIDARVRRKEAGSPPFPARKTDGFAANKTRLGITNPKTFGVVVVNAPVVSFP